MLTLIQRQETPPGGMFKYLVPETNRWVPDPATFGGSSTPAFSDLVDLVRQHYKANQLEAPSNLEARIEDQVCHSIPGKFCRDEFGHKLRTTDDTTDFSIAAVVQGTRTLLDHLVNGRDTVSPDEASRRAAICLACPMHGEPTGCSACNSSTLKDLANRIVGGGRVNSPNPLLSCRVCGCLLEAAVKLPLDRIQKFISHEQMAHYPRWCWKLGPQPKP